MSRYPLPEEPPVGWKSLRVVAWDAEHGLLISIRRGEELSLVRWLGSFEEQELDSPISQQEVDKLQADALEVLRKEYGPGFRSNEGTIEFSAPEAG